MQSNIVVIILGQLWEGTLNFLDRHTFINSYNLAGRIASKVAMLFYSSGTPHAICSSERSNEQVRIQ